MLKTGPDPRVLARGLRRGGHPNPTSASAAVFRPCHGRWPWVGSEASRLDMYSESATIVAGCGQSLRNVSADEHPGVWKTPQNRRGPEPMPLTLSILSLAHTPTAPSSSNQTAGPVPATPRCSPGQHPFTCLQPFPVPHICASHDGHPWPTYSVCTPTLGLVISSSPEIVQYLHNHFSPLRQVSSSVFPEAQT